MKNLNHYLVIGIFLRQARELFSNNDSDVLLPLNKTILAPVAEQN